MNKRLAGVVAAVCWAGLAVATAAPANAFVQVAYISADYASCSADYTVDSGQSCITIAYTQTIKFVSTPCNSGACSDHGSVWTDMLYPTGRKTATLVGQCPFFAVYSLGTCEC